VANPQDDPTRRLQAPRRLVPPAAAPTAARAPAAPSSKTRRLLPTLAVATALALVALWAAGPDAPVAPAVVEAMVPAAPSPSPATAPPAIQATAPAPAPKATLAAAAVPGAVALADFEQMLGAAPAADWRAWRFKTNPAVLVIEFPSLHEQGLAMNRLAAMFEKRNVPRDRLLTDSELAALVQRNGDSTASFYQGHDYPAANVARFFTLASSAPATLNAHERRLLARLLDAGVLAANGSAGFSAPGAQAVVSFTALQADDPSTAADEMIDPVRRHAVLRHELSHGEYFTNPAYRAHSQAFWSRRLSAQERKTWKNYLASLDYDPKDEVLMANEAQAMLMHTPDARGFSAGALGVSDAALASMRQRFRAGEPAHGLGSAGR